MNKKINIVWCDDEIDTLLTEETLSIFDKHGCHILETTKTAGELKKFLNENENIVDAVIVDLNLGKGNSTPDKKQADGFRYIHERIEDYPYIPFYLYSGRELDFIEKIYSDLQYPINDDYFFSENEDGDIRYFNKLQDDSLSQLLDMLVEEVNTINTPAYQIKNEYSEAFKAIETFGVDSKVFLDILLMSDTSNSNQDLDKIPNALRKVIEDVFISKHFTPNWYNLNQIPNLLSGKDANSKYYKSKDFMHPSLAQAFSFFLDCTNDGSHSTSQLKIRFDEYLQTTQDVYIIKSLAIIGLDLIKWANIFEKKYHNCFEKTERIVRIKETQPTTDKKGNTLVAFVAEDEDGVKYWLIQNLCNKDTQLIRRKAKISNFALDKDPKHGCNYYVNWNDWKLIEDEDSSAKTEDTSDVVTLNPPIAGIVQSTNIEGAEILFVTSDDGQKYRIEEDNDRPNPIDANVKIEGHSGRDPIYKDYFFVPSSLWEFNYD